MHPNLGAVSLTRLRLELNATQRTLQAPVGRSSLLFRPPYNADAEPATAEEVRPVVEAARLGYLTVGDLIDPQDWNLLKPGPSGQNVFRTARDVADDIVTGVQKVKGNIVLLHDGGGDRQMRVDALTMAIPRLLAGGRRFVRVSELAGVSSRFSKSQKGCRKHV